jgi:hypothetical protein
MFEEVFQTLLNLPDVRVTCVERTKAGDYNITIESTLSSTTCRRCGRQIATCHG